MSRAELLPKIISSYKASEDFRQALTAQAYFEARNEAIAQKVILKPVTALVSEETTNGTRTRKRVEQKEIVGARISSNIFFRLVTQECQRLLGNGLTLDMKGGEKVKDKLGVGFDTHLQQIGEKALIHGCCWGLWNQDHVEIIDAAKDGRSGFVALVDEQTSAPRVGVQFWQLSEKRPMYIRLFEEDGVTLYRQTRSEDGLEIVEPKRAYVRRIYTDAAGSIEVGTQNYAALPVVPLYANPEQRSELTPAIKSKIDAYDRISSDFVDNLDRANEIYWVLNNFGGTQDDIAEIVGQFERLKMIVNQSDGMGGGSTAEPHSFEVPYEARRVALELLEKEIYKDFMGLSLEEITGGSLTNVAIVASETNLELKCDRFEWQVFRFVQGILRLIGVETEQISFVRQGMTNRSEIVSDLSMMDYVDTETKLELNPYIDQEDIEGILERLAVERYAGAPVIDDTEMGGAEDDANTEEGSDDFEDELDREADAP